MLRTALKPRWLGLIGVVVLVVIALVQLGRWQLGVAQDKALAEQLAAAKGLQSVEIGTVLQPHRPFPGALSARPVTATGQYAAAEQVLIPDRRLHDQRGYWVVTALHTQAGPILPVLRGFVTSADAVPAAPPGTVTITGGLAPGESQLSGDPLPAGQLRSLDLATLVNMWPGDLYNAFVFLENEVPGPGPEAAAAGSLNGLTHVPTPTAAPGLNWRNAAYAAQWWVFAAFAFWLWWRMVRDAHRARVAEVDASGDDAVDPRADGDASDGDATDQPVGATPRP